MGNIHKRRQIERILARKIGIDITYLSSPMDNVLPGIKKEYSHEKLSAVTNNN